MKILEIQDVKKESLMLGAIAVEIYQAVEVCLEWLSKTLVRVLLNPSNQPITTGSNMVGVDFVRAL